MFRKLSHSDLAVDIVLTYIFLGANGHEPYIEDSSIFEDDV